MSGRIFASFVQAGFECSTHRLKDGRRLDLIASTAHDRFAAKDYAALRRMGIRTVREGLRWHLIEPARGTYNFATAHRCLEAGVEAGMEQITDLFHFGWPDHIDIFKPEFVSSFAELAFQFARQLRPYGINNPFIAPMNEISFVSWAGGDVAYINPFQKGRGPELKRQLARAALAGARAFLSELPATRLVWPEPVIHIFGDPAKPGDEAAAEAYSHSMYESWDMISGRMHPELGGHPDFLPIIGVNFYDRNEWMNHGKTVKRSNPKYRPFHQILLDVWNRYRVPMFVSETGTENEDRPAWFAYIASEVRKAMELGVPMHGVCLYPILNHPGWTDDRHCCNGLFDYAQPNGDREVYAPLAAEIQRQQILQSEFDRKRNHHEPTIVHI